MLRQGRGIAQYDELHSGTGNRDIHPAKVGEETDLSAFVSPDEADKYHIPLLPLESIDCMHCD